MAYGVQSWQMPSAQGHPQKTPIGLSSTHLMGKLSNPAHTAKYLGVTISADPSLEQSSGTLSAVKPTTLLLSYAEI